jgi:predicted metal-dependent peptidase
MISQQDGDKIVEQEGYEKDGGNESSIERDWADAAIKNSAKLPGDKAGNLKSKIEQLYKVTKDWKKELRKIVGHSISPEDKRSAYANKNILISQNRIARTDKDKYDNMDYMMAWIDSSGSMSDDQLRQCLSEVYAVALAKKPIKLVVIQCDTKIQDIKEYTDLKQLKKDMVHATVKGRGGTELKPCWDLLINDPKYKRRPAELVMVFTDGYLNQYKRNPKTMRNLCWVILDNAGWRLQNKDINTKVIHINTGDIK